MSTNYESIIDQALRAQVKWAEQCCREVDPRDICHCTLLFHAKRPGFCQFLCRGVVISQFQIVSALNGKPL